LSVVTTNQKGAIAEAAIAYEALKLGIDVYRPVAEGGRYHLILDAQKKLLRIQCKWAARVGDVVVVRCYSARRARVGQIRRRYTAQEIDAIAAYCAELERSFLIPIEELEGKGVLHLRLSPARNNQTAGIRSAEEFEFAARLTDRHSEGP
jgi:PD-(D/E)XK nuclease superfamily protein